MKKVFSILAALALGLAITACGEKEEQPAPAEEFTLLVSVPSKVEEVSPGMEITVKFFSGKGPKLTDKVVLKKDGKEIVLDIKSIDSDSFVFVVPEGIEAATYTFCVRRGSTTKEVGKISFTLPKLSSVKIDPAPGATVYGLVFSGDKALAGVPVTDGYEIVLTDSKGVYQLNSNKRNGLVYITTPSGYTAQCLGVQAMFYQSLKNAPEIPERRDFELEAVGDQTNHTMMFFGDIHLANRTNDRNQFATFTREVDSYAKAHGSDKIYAMTLGDMTWDQYWYSNNYVFSNYLADINANVKSITVYHTMGNHDHDMKTAVSGASAGWDEVDWDTATAYRKSLGPNYYSFNIGQVHYIVLDDIYCKNTTGGTAADRVYTETVCSDDLNWLRKDLALVDKTTPVVVTMHAALYNQAGNASLTNASVLTGCFAGFSDVTFVTGHTHKMWTVDKTAINLREHNSGAVCATWWWAGNYYPTLNIAQDGAPGGYRIMDVKGKTLTSYYKGTGRPESYQFRSYDRNQVNLQPFIASTAYAAEFDAYATKYGKYNTVSSDNIVLINVWDYNSNWKVEVTENGKALTVTRVSAYDPLYFITYSAKRFNSTNKPTFDVYNTNHMFQVKASAPNTTLEIKVTDDDGRVYTETMARPKAFTIDTYK